MTYNAIARLADPDALGRAALEGGSVDVVVSVPVGAFADAHDLMRPIMEDGAPHLEAWLTEEGHSEEELRLLCGLHSTVEDNLPMDDAHHLKRLEATGLDQYLDEFAARRVARMKGCHDLSVALDAALRGLLRLSNDDEARAMPLDDVIDPIWCAFTGRLDRLEATCATLVNLSRAEKARRAVREG